MTLLTAKLVTGCLFIAAVTAAGFGTELGQVVPNIVELLATLDRELGATR